MWRCLAYPLRAAASNIRFGAGCLLSGGTRARFLNANTTAAATDETRVGRDYWALNWGIVGLVLFLTAALGVLALALSV